MHKPVAPMLPFHCKVFHKPPTQAPSRDAAKIVHIAKQGGPETSTQLARFRHDVAEKIAPVQTVIEAGRLSLLVSEVARQHFPKMQEATHQTARWQHTEVKQRIKDMWKARRSYKREDGKARRVTLEAALGRWRTWSSYYRLYKQHRERCRTTKKTYILEQMNIAEKQPVATISVYCTRSYDRLHPNPEEAGHNFAIRKGK